MLWERLPNLDARLLVLDSEGLSQPEIATQLSSEFGLALNRNQVKNRLARVKSGVLPRDIYEVDGQFRVCIKRGQHVHTVGTFATKEQAVVERDKFIACLDEPRIETDEYTIKGVTAEDRPDFDSAFRRAKEEYQRKSLTAIRKVSQRIEFPHSPVCIVFTGDHHMGNAGTDIERVFDEARIVAETPGMYMVTLGDFMDGFILDRLRHVRDNSRQGIEDEWALLEGYLNLVKDKLLLCVSGNHEGWSQDLTGRDWLRRTVAEYAPRALYDSDDCRVVIEVAGVEFAARIRHKWRGNSIYNVTHAMERAQKWDQDFVLGVGGHYHTAGVSRQFPAAGRNGLAVMIGSYKRQDTYAAELGLPKANNSTSIAVVFDAETESMVGMDNLAMAAKVMKSVVR